MSRHRTGYDASRSASALTTCWTSTLTETTTTATLPPSRRKTAARPTSASSRTRASLRLASTGGSCIPRWRWDCRVGQQDGRTVAAFAVLPAYRPTVLLFGRDRLHSTVAAYRKRSRARQPHPVHRAARRSGPAGLTATVPVFHRP